MKNSTLILLCLFGMAFGVNAQTSGGPDAYGYTWRNSDDGSGPTYSWIDITTSGTQITGFTDDNSVPFITMSQPFHYYWSDYTQVKPGSNGWIGFDNTANIAHCFPTIPTAGGTADNYLAPMMTDLIFNAPGSSPEAWYYDDVANNRFIMSYINVPWWSATGPGYVGSNTFQVILSRADSSITYQYQDVDQVNLNDQGTCAADLEIGIENLTGNIGLEVYNEVVPADSLAIKFYYPDPVLLQVPDAAPVWSQNADNKAQFYASAGTISPSALVQNVGNADILTDIIVVSELQDMTLNIIWTQTDTIFGGLAASATSSLTYSNIGPFAPGQYFFNTTTVNGSDINPGNNQIATEVEIVDMGANPIMMTYATQGPSMGSLAWTGGGGAGQYMVPPSYPIVLDSVSMFIANGGLADDYFVRILADDGPGGSPGTVLGTETVLNGSYVLDSWVITPFTTPISITSGGFYLTWEHIIDGTIALGTESSGPISHQSWEYVGGSWAEYRLGSNTELMMNAYFTGACGSLVSNIASIAQPTCFGISDGAIDLDVTGGQGPFTYLWSNGSTTEDISALPAGTYDVTITDNNGCIATQSVTVTEPGNLATSVVTSSDISCNGLSDGSIDIGTTGGTAPYTYTWSNGGTTEDLSGLGAGTYDVAAIDANACVSSTTSVTITEPTAITSSATSTDELIGADGSINLTVSGGTPPYSYSWDNGAGIVEDPSGLIGGTYTCTITDANGCTHTEVVVVDSQVGIFEVSNDFDFVIYPNPNNGQFNIDLGALSSNASTIEVLNALGQVIRTQAVNGNSIVSIELEAGKGIYFVRVSADSGVSVRRVVID